MSKTSEWGGERVAFNNVLVPLYSSQQNATEKLQQGQAAQTATAAAQQQFQQQQQSPELAGQ